MTGKEHNKLLSIFFFVQGGLQLFGGVIVGIMYAGIGGAMLANSRREEEQVMGGIFMGLGIVVGIIMLVFAALDFLIGFKMLKEKPIGRTLGIIGSILSLFSFPLGTALGVYGLWFLFGDKGKDFYALAGHEGQRLYAPPPPPNSWQ